MERETRKRKTNDEEEKNEDRSRKGMQNREGKNSAMYI